jgi:outer membrane protein assembly factor BamB
VTGCSGAPKTCAPLWTAATSGNLDSSPAVANGVVFVGSEDHDLYAFDAAGSMQCSGIPKTCLPLWTGTTADEISGSPAVVDGIVYVGSSDAFLYAFGLP